MYDSSTTPDTDRGEWVIGPCSPQTYLSILAAHATFWTSQGRSDRRFLLDPFRGAVFCEGTR